LSPPEGSAAATGRRRVRAWRRGTREMDLILGPFADTRLTDLDERDQVLFERLLNENDHDLYRWVTARLNPSRDASDGARGPAAYGALLDLIAEHAAHRWRRTAG
jgi:antitoxin CptB